MNTLQGRNAEMIFRKTNTHVGRKIYVSPANSPMHYLSYARIILDGTHRSVEFSTGAHETGLICLGGEGQATIDGTMIVLARFDAVYVPRDSNVEISTTSSVDVAEFSAEVAKRYPLQVVRQADVAKNPGLHYTAGSGTCTRHLNLLLAKNIEAGRLIIGTTHSDPGNWTSWPPHEHGKMLEEIYLYFDMPSPAFGVQLVYKNTDDPEFVEVVREGDAVMLPGGYHPNVSVPGHPIAFVWAMAARRESEDRQYGVVSVQPGFNQGPTGLEAGQKK